jgi:hypothetical protein
MEDEQETHSTRLVQSYSYKRDGSREYLGWGINEFSIQDRKIIQEGGVMQTTKSNIPCFWIIFLILVPALVWALSCGSIATAGYADSAHGDSSDGVKRSDCQDSQEPPQACPIGSCAHCHDTFDPDICTGVTGGPNMLFAGLDSPDFCMECHTDSGSVQVGGMTGGAANIENVFTTKTFKHNVLGYSGLHRFWYASPPAEDSGDVEDRTYLSANKHVECNDCHNPHLAEAELHSSNEFHVAARTNEIDPSDPLYPDAGPLKGALGVEPTWSTSNWGGATGWPSTSSTATKEYQICFKCHSNYNTSFASWGGADEAAWTNLALEFNTSNNSYHPVVLALPEDDQSYTFFPPPDPWVSDGAHSNRLPPAFTSPLIGDSGLSTYARYSTIDIDADSTNGKRWQADQWINWGVRVGTLTAEGNMYWNQVGRITDNDETSLTVDWQSSFETPPYENDVVYSIEYYAGRGSKSDKTITDTTKDFNQYLPSLKGYVVVVFDKMWLGEQHYAKGTVVSNDTTSFTVDDWIPFYNPGGDPAVPADTTDPKGINYYFSATGQSMMCCDCHSNDTISTTAAQGPHGSAVKWMLKGRNKAWPTLSKADNGLGTGTLRKLGMRTLTNHRAVMDGNPNGDGLFCLNCHSLVSFSKNKYGVQDQSNVHIYHAANWPQGPECVRCHIMVPHGGKLSRLIGDRDGAMPARYAFNNDLSNMWVTKYWKTADDPAGYEETPGKGNDWCSVHCHGTCPYHHPCDDNGSNW